MANDSCKKVNSFLLRDELGNLFSKLKELKTLNEKIAKLLDPNLAPYCQVANMSGNKLVLLVANGSVATQIRFNTRDLLMQLKKDPDLARIQEIQCKVRPQFSTKPSSPWEKMPPLTAKTAELVDGIADAVKDSALRDILKKIASRRR